MKQSYIVIGADHAGFALKEKIKQALTSERMEVRDLTPNFVDGDDYPKVGFEVARAVSKNPKVRGILVCGSGVGISIAANRVKGTRAFDAHSVDEVEAGARTQRREYHRAFGVENEKYRGAKDDRGILDYGVFKSCETQKEGKAIGIILPKTSPNPSFVRRGT